MSVKPYYNEDVTIFAETNFRDQRKKFGIKRGDRRKHMYILGKAGMGKTALIEHLLVQDFKQGEGLCLIDSQGYLIEKILHYIPKERMQDVLYFNAADVLYPVAFNILESVGEQSEAEKQMMSRGLIAILQELWPDIWSAKLDYIFSNALMSLSDRKGATFLHLKRLLGDENYRLELAEYIKDPVMKLFWLQEYQNNLELNKAAGPLKDKVEQIVHNSLIRNIIGQSQSSFNFEEILDKKKIVLLSLPREEIGREAMQFLGSIFILKLAIASRRQDRSAEDFYLYIDEFQNFALKYLVDAISSSRKLGLNLIISNQYLGQIPKVILESILANSGTLVAFRLGADDARVLEREFASVFTADDLIKLGQHDIALKLSIDGETSKPFSARSLEPLPIVGLKDRIIKYSREHYTHHKKYVEERVFVDLGLEPQESRAEPQAELDKSDKEVGKEVKVEVSELVKEEVKESRGVGQEFIEVKVMENGEKKELCPDEEVVF